MLILKELQLINFLSHPKTILKFEKNQQILIDGKSGSGKSSVIEAIIWCLYNKGRSDSKSLIKIGTDKMSVTVILVDDNDDKISYSVTRSITKKSKHDFDILKKEGKSFKPLDVSGLKNIQEHLEKEILHSSYLLFINSIVYPQENINSFVFQTAEKKKDILLEIIGANKFDEYLKKSKDSLSVEKVMKDSVESQIEDNNNTVVFEKETASKLKEHQDEEKKIEGEIKVVNEKLKELGDKKLEYVEKKTLLDGQKKDIENLTSDIEDKKQKLEELNDRYIELANVDLTILEKKVEELKVVKEQLNKAQKEQDTYVLWNNEYTKIVQETPVNLGWDATIGKLNEKIIKIMSEKIEECPEIKKKCPILETKQRELIESTQKELKDVTDALNSFKVATEAHTERLDAIGTKEPVSSQLLENLRTTIGTLEPFEKQLIEANSKGELIKQVEKDLATTKTEMEALVNKVEMANKEYEKISEEVTKLSSVNIETSIKNDNLVELQVKQTHNVELLTGAKLADKRVKESENKLIELKKEFSEKAKNIDSLVLIKEAFGPNGVRAIMIDYVIPQLEDKINDILSKLSDFRVRLDTQKSGAGKEVVLEGLFINIINDQGQESDFSNFSGGERIKIITAVSEALSEIQQMGFRIIDELFVGLDEESINSFVEVMLVLQERFSQLVCISHINQIKELFGESILVTKINGNSQIN